jgi:hypothetical protein
MYIYIYIRFSREAFEVRSFEVVSPPSPSAMDAFGSIKARLNAAEGMLGKAKKGSARLRAASHIQRDAVLALVANGSLLSAQKADLVDMVMSTGFEEADEEAILDAITKAEAPDMPCAKSGRRKMQNGVAFLSYVSKVEWDTIKCLGGQVLAVMDVFIPVLHDRCGIINATEPTKKWLASAAMVAAHPDGSWRKITLQAKNRYKKTCGDRLTQRYRKETVPPPEYIVLLPATLAELKLKYPKTFEKVVNELGSELVPVHIDMDAVLVIDKSHNCRRDSGDDNAGLQLALSGGQQGDMPMHMFQQMMQTCMMQMNMHAQNMNRADNGDDQDGLNGLKIHGNRGNRSSLKALANMCGDDLQSPAGLKRERKWEDPDVEGQLAESPSSRPAVESIASSSNTLPPSPRAESPKIDRKRKARDLCEALVERDVDRALEAKKKKAEEKAEAKAAGNEANAATNAAKPSASKASKRGKIKTVASKMASDVVEKSKMTSDVVKKGKGDRAVKAIADLPSADSPPMFKAKPSFSNERSRFQILCRTGLKGPGQSLAIQYQPKGELTIEQAIGEANAFIEKHS